MREVNVFQQRPEKKKDKILFSLAESHISLSFPTQQKHTNMGTGGINGGLSFTRKLHMVVVIVS